MAFPTATGGNTSGICPLSAYTNDYEMQHGTRPASSTVQGYIGSHPKVDRCYHHRLDEQELKYAAELSCWFVDEEQVPEDFAIDAVVRRDGYVDRGREEEIAKYVYCLFIDPIRWHGRPGTEVDNGRHRVCALKLAGIPRVAVWIPQ